MLRRVDITLNMSQDGLVLINGALYFWPRPCSVWQSFKVHKRRGYLRGIQVTNTENRPPLLANIGSLTYIFKGGSTEKHPAS